MPLKDKWKDFGKSTGEAFTDFGEAVVETVKVAFSDENDPDQNQKLKESWKKTGKGFGEAGKNLGKAAKGTLDKVCDDEKKEPQKEEHPQETIIEAEVIEENEDK